MADEPVSTTEAVIGPAILEADAIIRDRLKAARIRLPHVILAVDDDGNAYVRSNAGPDALREMAGVLLEIAKGNTPPVH